MRILQLDEATIFDENELKRRVWQSPKELATWLRANGFRRLGGGVFGAAFGKPGHKRVVKISTKEDKCWLAFAMWVMNQHNNPHLPHIPWVKTYGGTRKSTRRQIGNRKLRGMAPRAVEQQFFVTVIERLQPFKMNSLKQIHDPIILLALLRFGDFEEEMNEEIEAILTQDMGQRIQNFSKQNLTRLLTTKAAKHPFVKALRHMKNIAGADCYHDIHEGNLMMRGGTVVLTDPLAGDFTGHAER